MSEVTVRTLAKLTGTPVEKLLEQLAEAGMSFSGPDQVVTSAEKMKLLGFLRRTHGKTEPAEEASAPRQITLKRRKVEEITVAAGKQKTTVNVEVRQKRTYVKRSEISTSEDPGREEAQRLLAESQARQEAEEAARIEAEQRKAAEAERQREEEEARRRAAEAPAAVEASAPVPEPAPAVQTPAAVAPAASTPSVRSPAPSAPTSRPAPRSDSPSSRPKTSF